MGYEELRERVCAVNRAIGSSGLAPLTWGNASGFDRVAGVVGIKPSGVAYANLDPSHIVVLTVDGSVVEGDLRPSSDLATHLHLYRNFPAANGIVHTHSRSATVWAQACQILPCMGTTHADHFCGPIPVTRDLTDDECGDEYVLNTGKVIVEVCTDPEGIPAVLVARHAPFVWGHTIEEALDNAIALEQIAHMAINTRALDAELTPMPKALLNRHFQRKHGPDATYGQEP